MKTCRLRIAVVDSNNAISSAVSAYIRSFFECKKISAAVDTFGALTEFVKDCADADLLFIETVMPDGDGIAAAAEYLKLRPTCAVVFVTKYENKVFEALKIHPFGFVRKPRFFYDIDNVLEHFVKHIDEHTAGAFITVKGISSVYRLKPSEIIYIEAYGHIQEIYTINEPTPYKANETLKSFSDALTSRGFIACHKSFLVNERYINKIQNNAITLCGGKTIYVSKRRSAELKKKYK